MTDTTSSDDQLDAWLGAQYSALVQDLAGTLDIEASLAEVIQPSCFAELVTDLNGLLNLDAGLTAILPDSSVIAPVSGYTPIRSFGACPAGSAVLAWHDASGSPVVIRFLPAASLHEPEYLAQIRVAAKRLAGLQHSAVARLVEYVETDQGVAVVREHIDGVTVRTMLGEEGALGPQAALTVLKGTLLGLAAAHARGVLHRGCTPATVLITRTGGIVLAEFGITGPVAAQSLVSGSYFYLAPERWDAGEATPATDLYSAAATCFECVAGAPPFFSEDLAVLRSRHQSTPPPIEMAPEAIRDLLRRGLAKIPADRPGGAAEFLAELEETAVRGYGVDWEARGRTELAELANGARPPFFRLDPATLAGPGQSAQEEPPLDGLAWGSGRIAAAVTFTLAVMVPLGGIDAAISVAFVLNSICALLTLISVLVSWEAAVDRPHASPDQRTRRGWRITRTSRGMGKEYRDPRWHLSEGVHGAHRCETCQGRGTVRLDHADQHPSGKS